MKTVFSKHILVGSGLFVVYGWISRTTLTGRIGIQVDGEDVADIDIDQREARFPVDKEGQHLRVSGDFLLDWNAPSIVFRGTMCIGQECRQLQDEPIEKPD